MQNNNKEAGRGGAHQYLHSPSREVQEKGKAKKEKGKKGKGKGGKDKGPGLQQGGGVVGVVGAADAAAQNDKGKGKGPDNRHCKICLADGSLPAESKGNNSEATIAPLFAHCPDSMPTTALEGTISIGRKTRGEIIG